MPMWIAPIGVLALAFSVGTRTGVSAAGALLKYVMLVVGSCLVTTLFTYFVAALLGRMSPFAFAQAALPAQVVAASTQSSLAALPAMIDAAGPLDVGKQEAGIVPPLTVSFFQAASAAANVTVPVYARHADQVHQPLAAIAFHSSADRRWQARTRGSSRSLRFGSVHEQDRCAAP